MATRWDTQQLLLRGGDPGGMLTGGAGQIASAPSGEGQEFPGKTTSDLQR